MRITRLATFTATAALLAGCESLELTAPGDRFRTENGAATAITTDAGQYTLRPEGAGLQTTITIRFENLSQQRMYIVNCQGSLAPILQKRVDGTWVDYWSPAVPACLSPPVVLEPGAFLSRQLHIWGALPGANAAPAWASADVAGTYRMVLTSVVWNYNENRQGFGNTVPESLRASNEFTLVLN